MSTRTLAGVAGAIAVFLAVGVVVGMSFASGGGPLNALGGGAGTEVPADTPSPTPTPDTATATPTPSPAPASVPATVTPATGPAVSPTAVEFHIYRHVNRVRTGRGYEELPLNDTLRAIARNHSRDMATEGFLDTEGSDGRSLPDRYRRAGVDCHWNGELVGSEYYDEFIDVGDGTNVTYDTPDEVARAIVRAWMDADGQRSEVFRSEWESEGVGVAVAEEDGKTVVYATLDFCGN